ncbi:MAG: endolytic transglycosylase MltG, partial [Nitrospirae bacterium]|nr:endolytic transglycosylase MltG [Nitrospirota bacterium]
NLPYIYFVAKKDGTHHFSTTYREHREAINRYQRQGAAAPAIKGAAAPAIKGVQ